MVPANNNSCQPPDQLDRATGATGKVQNDRHVQSSSLSHLAHQRRLQSRLLKPEAVDHLDGTSSSPYLSQLISFARVKDQLLIPGKSH